MIVNTMLEAANVLNLGDGRIKLLREAYTEPHRFYHTESHIDAVVKDVTKALEGEDGDINDWTAAVLAAVYHDVVYNPRSSMNEIDSACVLAMHVRGHFPDVVVDKAIGLVRATAFSTPKAWWDMDRYGRALIEADCAIVRQPEATLLLYADLVYREYQFHSYADFVPAHVNVLRKVTDGLGLTKPDNFNEYESLLRKRVVRVGLLPGSFNPWHKGHADILRQAQAVFDKVVVARGANPDKISVRGQSSVTATRIENVPVCYETVEFQGTLMDLYSRYQAPENYDVSIVRGIRNATDLESEITQRRFVQDYAGKIPYTFFIADPSVAHISSTAVRNLQKLALPVTAYV